MYILDSLIWILSKILPGKLLIKIFIIKNWNHHKFNIIKGRQIYALNYIIKTISRIQNSKDLCSNCLSLSITTKILLDFINIPCSFNLGFTNNHLNKKTPHAWISDLTGNKFYTIPLNSKLVKTYYCDYNK